MEAPHAIAPVGRRIDETALHLRVGVAAIGKTVLARTTALERLIFQSSVKFWVIVSWHVPVLVAHARQLPLLEPNCGCAASQATQSHRARCHATSERKGKVIICEKAEKDGLRRHDILRAKLLLCAGMRSAKMRKESNADDREEESSRRPPKVRGRHEVAHVRGCFFAIARALALRGIGGRKLRDGGLGMHVLGEMWRAE